MIEALGERLIRLRKRSGLTQVEVSAATDIARTYLSKMERQSVPATWENMCALADLYQVSLDYLRFGEAAAQSELSLNAGKDSVELALLRVWRMMEEDEKKAFLLLLNKRIEDKAA